MVASFSTAPSLAVSNSPLICPATLASPQLVSVLIVNDDPALRQGLSILLSFYSASSVLQFAIADEAETHIDALKLAVRQPALILFDLELPPGTKSGISALKRLREFYQGKVVVLSADRQDDRVFQAMQAGASGYVVKDRLAAQLCTAITTVLTNQIYLAPEVMTQFFQTFRSRTDRAAHEQQIHLSEREREVLLLLAEGDPNAKIAQRLYITVATVKAHLTSIFEKLGVKSRSQAIVMALKLDLV